MLLYAMFSHLLNITFSYLIINSYILKNKKKLLLLPLMIGSAGIVSDRYPFINDLVFFLFLFLLTIKTGRKQSIFLSTIIVVCPFLIVGILTFFTSKLLLLLILNIKTTIAVILLELSLYILIYLFSYVVKKKFIPFIQKKQKEKITVIILIGIYMICQSYEIYNYYFGKQWLSVISIIIILAFSVLIYLFIQSISTSQELEFEVEKQRIEVKYMNEYAKETTKQYNEIRKFKHDYVNILSSLDYFIQTNDMSKLAAYYHEFIQPTKYSLSTLSFNFQELDNIESDEIKSIFAIKLLSAREKQIHVRIEVPDKIPIISSINPVSLIRMLSIIIDNSIEEVSRMASGTIEIGVFDRNTSYVFMIKNSVRENIEPLYQLEVEGYSTKGENRGLGLSNLNEISKKEKNVTLETEVTPFAFIQKITLMRGKH